MVPIKKALTEIRAFLILGLINNLRHLLYWEKIFL